MKLEHYLAKNMFHHTGARFSGHSFPCHAWNLQDTRQISWEYLTKHGMMPKFVFIIHLKETNETESDCQE